MKKDYWSQYYGMAINYAQNIAIAVGFMGVAAYSTDTTFLNWDTLRVNPRTDMYNVRWIDNKFIAAGTQGKLVTFNQNFSYTIRKTCFRQQKTILAL